MSKLAALTGKSVEEFNKIVSELEALSGLPSEDVRQSAEATQAMRVKLSQLGLDPDDTTPQELYHALIARYRRDAANLERAVRVNLDSGLKERVSKAAKLVAHSLQTNEIWVLKNSAAKNLIKQNPPKNLMKKMHYRSVDSLLKHQDITLIFIGAALTESAAWYKKVENALAKLGTVNYELRQPRIVELPENLLRRGSDSDVLIDPVIGAVALNPDPASKTNTLIISLALNMIDGLESLSEQETSHYLYNAHPSLAWWASNEGLIYAPNGELVSLNIKDVARNCSVGGYENRQYKMAQHSFWQRLMSRYKQYLDELPGEVVNAGQVVTEKLTPAKELVPQPMELEV